MGEDSFFDALAHIMWDMEVDIFSEKDRTLALVMDFAPRCKKQYSRLKVMYECGAMDLIERAVGDKDNYAELMWEAADKIMSALHTDEEHAAFAVNRIIALWDGDLPELEPEEDEDDIEAFESFEVDDKKQEYDEQEGDDVIFLQDVAEEQQDNPEQAPAEEQNEQPSSGESILKKIVHFWCSNECEQGRPLMITCPIGWVEILLCCALGVFMIYDVTVGDKLSVPVFMFMFIVLVGKRHYRFDSVGRLSIALAVFYLAAAVRAVWVGSAATLRCVPIIAAALIVFNNGRFSVFLDGQKRRPAAAYTLIILMSAAVAAGTYAIQNVEL